MGVYFADTGSARIAGPRSPRRRGEGVILVDCPSFSTCGMLDSLRMARLESWADLREDEKISPAPDFSDDFQTFRGPGRAPEAPGTDPVRQILQDAQQISPGDQI